MGENSLLGEKFGRLFEKNRQAGSILKNKNKLLMLSVFALLSAFINIWNSDSKFYAHAYVNTNEDAQQLKEIISATPQEILTGEKKGNETVKLSAKKEDKNEVGQLEKQIEEIVGETPIKEMAPYIAKRNRTVAALIVGIAKKESSWGVASPSKNGKSCYNFWGYKGSGSEGTAMGYACFASAEEAVSVVGNRIEKLTSDGLNTPSKMIVWKCGSTCAGHDPAGVAKWISDVQAYFAKIMSLNA